MSRLLSAAALASEAGVSYRQVHYWTDQGYLESLDIEGVPSNGSGYTRVYAASEVEVARALGVFASSLSTWAPAVRQAVEQGSATFAGLRLTVEGRQP